MSLVILRLYHLSLKKAIINLQNTLSFFYCYIKYLLNLANVIHLMHNFISQYLRIQLDAIAIAYLRAAVIYVHTFGVKQYFVPVLGHICFRPIEIRRSIVRHCQPINVYAVCRIRQIKIRKVAVFAAVQATAANRFYCSANISRSGVALRRLRR